MKVKNKVTGRICELVAHGAGKYVTEFAVEEKNGSTIATYSTIEDLHEYWATYKEPLIKDEKIRNAVRAWWECCQEGIDDKRVYIKDAEFKMGIYRLDLGRYYFFDDKKEGFYTIAELCGEEEAPEPLEPSFIDLDERIREKEEE